MPTFRMLLLPMCVLMFWTDQLINLYTLLCAADFIRHSAQMSQQFDIIRHLPLQSLIPMFDGLNVVSSCAWAVNQPVSFVCVFKSCSCRMTNCEPLRCLVETLSCDIHHYPMLNVSAVDRSILQSRNWYLQYRTVTWTWPCITARYPNWSPLTCSVSQQYL